MSDQLDAIFFDAGGTLLYIYPSVGGVYADETRKMGVDLSDELLERRLHALWKDHAPTNRVREGDLEASDEKDRNMWRTFLRRLYEDLDELQELSFEQWFQNIFERFGRHETFRLYPETKETLQALEERGYILGVVSNWDSRLLNICSGLGLDEHMEFILPSAVAGFRKPSSNIFHQALEKVDVEPDSALHIGDKQLDDYEGAQKVGLTPVLLDRDERNEEEKITTISSLTQLHNLL